MADTASSAQNKWHRVCLNTIVRKNVELESERLRILPMGSRVHVIEKKGRRVRIDQPINGWCSLLSSTGDVILSEIAAPDEPLTTPKATNLKKLEERVQKAKQEQSKAADDGEKQKYKEEVESLTLQLEDMKTQLKSMEEARQKLEALEAADTETEHFRNGDCVKFPNNPTLGIGIVRFWGKVKDQGDEKWVGVEFDQPLGDSNGVVTLPNGEVGGFKNPVSQNFASFVKATEVRLLSTEIMLRKLVNVTNQLTMTNSTNKAE